MGLQLAREIRQEKKLFKDERNKTMLSKGISNKGKADAGEGRLPRAMSSGRVEGEL